MSVDMRRETERLEWEKSEKSPEVPSDPEILGAIPVHYQAVRNNGLQCFPSMYLERVL